MNIMVSPGLEQWRSDNARHKRNALLDAVAKYWAAHDFGPSRPELAEMTGMSERSVRTYVNDLIRDGLLEEPGGRRSRSLRISGM